MSAELTLQGMSIIGSLFGNTPERGDAKLEWTTKTNLLTGAYDDALLCACAFRAAGTVVPLQDAQTNDFAIASLNTLKRMLRKEAQGIFDRAAQQEKEKLLNDLKKSQAPHLEGTTKEIARKLNVSVSEVRRLKAAGTLDSALEKNLQEI